MTQVAALVAGVASIAMAVGVLAGYLWGRREGRSEGVEDGWRLGLERGRIDACAQLPGCALREGPVDVRVQIERAPHEAARTHSVTRDEMLRASEDLKHAAGVYTPPVGTKKDGR